MSQELRQTSFSGGEFAPTLYSRSDLEKYATALKRAFNVFITEHGGIKNRPGTLMVAETNKGGGAVGKFARLVRFRFSNSQSYILELTDRFIRFIIDGGLIAPATGLSAWSGLTRYSIGDAVTHSTSVWRCKAIPETSNPANHTDFVYLYQHVWPIPTETAWDVATTYYGNSRVSLAGSVYVALTGPLTGGGGPGVDTANWLLVGAVGAMVSPIDHIWDAASTYTAGERVQYREGWQGWGFYGADYYVRNNTGPAGAAEPDVDSVAWEWVCLISDPVTLATPWLEADLPRLKFAQSGDVISTAHHHYEPSEVRRKSHILWEYGQSRDGRPVKTRQWHASATYAKDDVVRYHRSLAPVPPSTVSNTFHFFFKSLQDGNTNKDPTTQVAWWTLVSGKSGGHLPPSEVTFLQTKRKYQNVNGYLSTIPDNTNIVDQSSATNYLAKEWQWVVTAIYSDGVESVASNVLEPRATYSKDTSRKIVLYPDKPVLLSWNVCPGAIAYRIYRGRNGYFGYVGESEPSKVPEGIGGGLFQDDAIAPDWARQPPTAQWPFGVRPWGAFQNYSPNDLIQAPNGNIYRCAVGGLSGLVAPVGVSGLLPDGEEHPWVKSTAYVVDDRVLSNDNVYRCIRNHTSSATVTLEDPPGPWGTGLYGAMLDFGWNETQAVFPTGDKAWIYLGRGGMVQWEFMSLASTFETPLPGTVLYHEGRRFYGSLGMLRGSCVDDYGNFDRSNPARSDEAVELTLASKEYEEIRSMASIDGGLMALCEAGEWLVTGGGQNEPISPNSALARRGGSRGSSWVDPLTVGEAIVFSQPRGGRVRELIWDGGQGRYAGSDLSIFSRHLFSGRQVVSWDYQEAPDSIIWVVFDDGTMASLTYNREHQMAAWTQHAITGGAVEGVCVIPDGDKDVVYMVVRRPNATVNPTVWNNVTNYFHGFYVTHAGKLWISSPTCAVGDEPGVAPLTSWIEQTEVFSRYIERFADRDIDPANPATWVFLDSAKTYDATPATVFSGLEHLEGQAVWALADGVPSGPYTVTAGAVTLPAAASKVVIGLLFDVELETLAFPQARGSQKIVSKVTVELESANVTVQAGETLSTLSAHTPTDTGLAVRDIEIRPGGRWNLTGSVAVKITSPTPMTLHAIRREVEGGGR